MNLQERFKQHVLKNNLFSTKDILLLAVSGGVDSVVLCELCKQSGYAFIIAHCNFQLRGEESERDEEFVKRLAGKYKVEARIKKFDTQNYATENKLSIQEAARELRYNWFHQLLAPGSELPSPSYLLTAHHADDNIETVLMNFFRGTGLHGLTGIPVKAMDTIRRPLLDFTKDELILFAKENNLDYVEDSSNQSSKYTRNFFRNEIIPAISKVYPQVKNNLQDNIGRFKEIEKLYKLATAAIIRKLSRQKGEEIHIPIKQLMSYDNRALIYEIISAYGFSDKQVDEVMKLAIAGSGSYIDAANGSYRIIKHRHWFILGPLSSSSIENIVVEQKDKNVPFPEGLLRLEESTSLQPLPGNHIACLDAKDIQFPLLLRKWKTGDYFYPLGMKKKKKLARFFIDQKLSKPGKEKTWVIEMNKKIIWIVGHRIDERFKITDKTKSVLKISWIPGQTG